VDRAAARERRGREAAVRAQRSERLTAAIARRTRDRLALVLAALLVALLHDDTLAHMAIDLVAERRALREAR